MTEQNNVANDYAVAKVLSEEVMAIVIMILIAYAVALPDDYQIAELNRAYVLLTNELQKLYNRNPELAAIKPEPIWKRFDVLRTSTRDINDSVDNPYIDVGQAHVARIDRLCIISGKETADLSSDQQKLLDDAKAIRINYGDMLDVVNKKRLAEKKDDWQVPEYALSYKPDGTILINNVLKLKKAHAGSITERLLEQALKNPNVLFKPNLGQTSRNISTVLNSAGFTATLRHLFFPTVSNSKGVVFRPTITRKQADDENINTVELDGTLKDLGAITEPKSLN